MKIIHVVGARPNFMKIAPIIEAIAGHNETVKEPMGQVLVHTGQHYDDKMSALFFNELGIPRPEINLDVGSGSHAEQTAKIMKRFEKVCLAETPSHILVVGDVNSTIACALVAVKLGIKVIHVEAGLRSFNRAMPEEINRILTDAISDLLFTSEASAEENLRREGIAQDKIHFVGNVMIDTLLKHKEKAAQTAILHRLGLSGFSEWEVGVVDYALLTLHRPSNVDEPETFRNILAAVVEIAKHIPVVFPVHPRTWKKVEEFGLGKEFLKLGWSERKTHGIYAIDPVGYLDFLALMSHARFVLTDSGGIQEETTVLGVPCMTLREETERPVTVTDGTNVLVGTKKQKMLRTALFIMDRPHQTRQNHPDGSVRVPPLWDGKAAKRIVRVLTHDFNEV